MSWIKSLLGMVGGKSVTTFIVVIIGLSILSYVLYQKNLSLNIKLDYEMAQKASIEANLKSSQEAIVTLNQKIITAQRASQELTETNKKLSLEFNDTKAKLESHINRLDKAFEKKPTLMLKITNKSFDKFIDKVSCNSGDLTSCKD